MLLIGLAARSEVLRNAALAAFALVALITLPVYFTGESAEKLVENLPGVTKAAIERHADAALVSLVAVEVLGALAAAALVLFQQAPGAASRLLVVSLVLSVFTGVWLVWTANLGGQIRHTEIRSVTPASPNVN
ncbi:MAG TPA: hypothetical protein VMV94_04500 [Phycisphaerae bacterium]|nr:hypothetical protein [Phycisphaerae bacterium]